MMSSWHTQVQPYDLRCIILVCIRLIHLVTWYHAFIRLVSIRVNILKARTCTVKMCDLSYMLHFAESLAMFVKSIHVMCNSHFQQQVLLWKIVSYLCSSESRNGNVLTVVSQTLATHYTDVEWVLNHQKIYRLFHNFIGWILLTTHHSYGECFCAMASSWMDNWSNRRWIYFTMSPERWEDL